MYSLRDNKKYIVLAFAFCAIIISLLFFGLSVRKPGTGLVLSLENEIWVVQSVDPAGAASQAGIIPGDRPETINGQPAEIFLERYAERGVALGFLIDDLAVVDKLGQTKTVDFAKSRPHFQSVIEVVIWFLVSLISWTVGLIVFLKKPRSQPALLLLGCSIAFGLALSATLASERFVPLATNIAVIATVIAPFLFLHFFIALPDKREKSRRSLSTLLIYLPAVIVIALYPFIGLVGGQPLQGFRILRLFVVVVALLVAVGVAFFNYFRNADIKTRQQMKIIFFGSLAAIVPFVALNLFPGVYGGTNVMPSSLSMLFIALVPLSMGYAIVTKKFMDIDIFLRRSAIFGGILLLMAIIFTLVIVVTLVRNSPAGVLEAVVIALVLSAVATVLFGPLSRWIEKIVDRLFYKNRYDHRVIVKELSNSLIRVEELDGAASIIAGTLVDILGLKGACLFIKTEDGSLQIGAVKGVFAKIGAEQKLTNLVSRKLKDNELFPNYASFADGYVKYIVPLNAGEKEIGFIVISPKESNEEFLPVDLLLIQDLADVAVVSLNSMLIISTDVAKRKKAEEALKKAAQDWRITFDSINDMIAIVGVDQKILRVNQAFADAFNEKASTLIGRYCHEVVHGMEEPYPTCMLEYASGAKKSGCYEIYEPKLGKHLELTLSPLKDDANGYSRVVHIFKDISERKNMEAEQQLLRNKAEMSSRLSTVGEMVAGIAHEINNPLTSVLGFSELLLKEDLPPDIQSSFKYIVDGSNRVKEIVKRLLTFARQSKPCKTNLDIHTLIDNTLELRSYVLKTSSIRVVKNYATDLPCVNVDPGQVQQVFMNIIVNAEYAMKKIRSQGVLAITTRKEGEYLTISIKDNGPGISQKVIKNVFDPFFTTKDPGEGTGLGLSLSRSIILEHGGNLEVESELDKGTVFIINLPVDGEPGDSCTEEVGRVEVEAEVKKGNILVIDDEESIRTYIRKALKAYGYSVSEAENYKQTLEWLEKERFDVLLLDIRMPGISGRQLYEQITSKWPHMNRKVIFITGDASDVFTRDFFKKNNLVFMTKPFDIHALLANIDKILSDI